MADVLTHIAALGESKDVSGWGWRIFAVARAEPADVQALILAIWSVPLSIAVAEFFLAIALLFRVIRCARGCEHVTLPRAFWFWLAWAGLTCLAWGLSPQPAAGWNEIRRLLLVASLFVVMPVFNKVSLLVLIWKGVFATATLGSLFLIGDFIWRCFYYRRELAAGGDAGFYLRSGGLLNHWMVFGTVEILVVGGLLAFWYLYPEGRRRWWPAIVINGLAVLLSLTRTVWVTSLCLLGLVLVWRRSRWLWALPAMAAALYFLAPGAVRSRLRDSMRPDYYSNFERIQMLRVGWEMIKDHPLTGVGPGRVQKLYPRYLAAGDPVPAYHGHLHNNLVEIATEFGLPVAAAALAFCGILLVGVGRGLSTAITREGQFISLAALLALSGFLLAGCFDYTYGHSLGLILLAFAVLPSLQGDLQSGISGSPSLSGEVIQEYKTVGS